MRRLTLLFLAVVVAGAWVPVHASRDYERYHAQASKQFAPRDGETPLAGSYAIVAFSPNGGGTQLIVQAINHARRTILVQAYSFSSRPIIHALEAAKSRGVDVYVILDHSDLRSHDSGLQAMLSHGIPVWIDTTVRIAHNKVMVIDGRDVITGSFNFSWSAQHMNAENVLEIVNSLTLARFYIQDWDWRRSLSTPAALRP